MVKCPNCDVKLDHLKWENEVTVTGKLYPDGRMINSSTEAHETIQYSCPECDMTLFSHVDDVVGFLKGKYRKAILKQRKKRQVSNKQAQN